MGKRSKSVAVSWVKPPWAGPDYVEGTITDLAYRLAQAAYDAYHQSCKDRFGLQTPVKSFGSISAAKQRPFLAIGRICAEEHWEPEVYVLHGLDWLRKRNRYIQPGDFNSQQVKDYVRTQLTTTGSTMYEPAAQWAFCTKSLLDQIDPANGVTELDVLRTPFASFPPWFRLLYPEHVDELIFDVYGQRGYNELSRDRRLRLFAREIAPTTFKELERRWGCFSDSEVRS